MSIVTKTSSRLVKKLFSTYKLHHVLAWLIILILFLQLSNSPITVFVWLGFLALVIYTNIYFLIPNYLSKKFLLYTVLLVLLCTLIAPIALTVSSILQKGTAGPGEAALFFLISFFVSGSTTVLKIINDWYRQQQESMEIEKNSMQTELKFLKSQINPHFLFNTLNNLYALTLKKSDNAPEIVVKLSEMMRYMLYECNEKRVPLSKELKYVTNYLDLEKLRQGDRSNISFSCQGNVSEQRIAPLIFIPFLENSFKHGLNSRIEKGFVNIDIKIEGQLLNFSIENSKPPPTPSVAVRKVGGIGLMNVKRRLNLIYPEAYDLAIRDSPDAYLVQLELELDKMD